MNKYAWLIVVIIFSLEIMIWTLRAARIEEVNQWAAKYDERLSELEVTHERYLNTLISIQEHLDEGKDHGDHAED